MNYILKQFNAVKVLFGDKHSIELKEETYLKYQDILGIMVERKYLWKMNADNLFIYHKNASLDDFESWLKEEIKESNRMKRRDWKISIISGVIGAVIGLIPWIVSLLTP